MKTGLDERNGNQRNNQDHTDYRIIDINQNTEESPGDLRKLAAAEIKEKSYQLTLEGKIH